MIWSKQRGTGKDYNLTNKESNTKKNQRRRRQKELAQGSDQQGYCGMDVDKMDLVGTIAYDRDFFDISKSLVVCGFTINGRIKLNGGVGLKVDYGHMKTGLGNGAHKSETRCSTAGKGTVVFAIPYAQATLTGELALDLGVTKGGGGVEGQLVRFTLPATSESMTDSSCGGVYLKMEGLAGKV